MTDNRYELLEAEIQRLTAENNQLKALTMSHTTTALEPYDKRLLTDLTKMWSEACEIARQYCPVDVGRNHIKEGIPRLAKRAADAEAERDKLRAQIEVYIDDCRDVMPIHWAFAGDEYAKPMRRHTYACALSSNEESWRELEKKIDTKIVEELSIASIVKANAELKKRVEVLEMAIENLYREKR